MKTLPLYSSLPHQAVELEPPIDCDQACSLCSLGDKNRENSGNVCVKPDGTLFKPGGLLVLGEHPIKGELQPFTSGRSAPFVRRLIEKYWGHDKGVVYDNAVRCAPGMDKFATPQAQAKFVRSCRPYLAAVLAEVKPSRVIALGKWAVMGVTGVSVDTHPLRMRRAYAHLYGDLGSTPIPVFFFPSAVEPQLNRFVKQAFEEDMEWALDPATLPMAAPVGCSAYVIENDEDAAEALHHLSLPGLGSVVFDIESTGQAMGNDFKIISVSCSLERSDRAFVWDRSFVNHPSLRSLFENAGTLKVGQNACTFDNPALQHALGIFLHGYECDTRLRRKLLDPEASGALDDMAWLVGMGGTKTEAEEHMAEAVRRVKHALKGDPPSRRKITKKPGTAAWKREQESDARHKAVLDADIAFFTSLPKDLQQTIRVSEHNEESTGRWSYGLLPADLLHVYNARDVMATGRLSIAFKGRVAALPELTDACNEIVDPASRAIAQITSWGVPVIPEHIDSFVTLLTERTEERLQTVRSHGHEFDLAKPKQLSEVLFTKLKLVPTAFTKKGNISLDEDALTDLAENNPGCAFLMDLLEWRRFYKLLNTYAKPMSTYVVGGDCPRIHPSILLDGARSGRASVRSPALQTIPRAETEEGKFARGLFGSTRRGYVIMQADYSTLELRIAAMLSEDPVMTQIFKDGHDYHKRTAEIVSVRAWGILPEKVEKKHRTIAKTINFGLLYGSGDAAIAAKCNMSREEAKSTREAILGQFKVLDLWIVNQKESVRETGVCWTEWNGKRTRRRPLWDIASDDSGLARHAENGAINCLDAETEALTQRGWVRGFDLVREDVILTKNPFTNALEWQEMTDLRLFPDYAGPVVEFKSKSFHSVSTLDHRWLVESKSRVGTRTCERTTRTLSPWGDDRIHRTGDYRPEGSSTLTPDEAELLGWFVTDGSIKRAKPVKGAQQNRVYSIMSARAFIHQSESVNASKCRRIQALLDRLAPGETRKSLSKSGTYASWNLGRRLSVMLLLRCPQRTLTINSLLGLSREALERLKDGMVLGDTHKKGICTGRKEQAEAFQTLVTMTGGHASIVYRDMSRYSGKKLYRSMRNMPKMTGIWLVHELERSTVQVTAEQRREITAKCPVWCPVVPNSFFVARRSGTVFITGNSPIQGTASDFCLKSLIAMVDWIDTNNLSDVIKLCLPIHDALLFEVREDWVERLAAKTQATMTGWESGGVPLAVDVEVGSTWGDLVSLATWLESRKPA